MTGPQRILVPIDFSRFTEPVIAIAVELAQKYAAKLTLMHAYVIPPMPYGGPFAWVMDELRADAQRRLQRMLQRTRERYPNCNSVLRGGVPREQILEAATETGADWIVMGTHGDGIMARFILGSVANRVIRCANVPVLTVPPERGVHSEN